VAKNGKTNSKCPYVTDVPFLNVHLTAVFAFQIIIR
jgi:hypothetical protein